MIRENTTMKMVSITKEVECDLCKAYKNFNAKSRHGVNKQIADAGWVINGNKGDKSVRNLDKYGDALCNKCYIRLRTDNAIEGDEYRYTHWDDDMPNETVLWNPTIARGESKRGLVHRHSYNLITDFAVWMIEAWAKSKIGDVFVDNSGQIYIRTSNNYGQWTLYSDMMNGVDNPEIVYRAETAFVRQMGDTNDGVTRMWHLKETD